MSVTAITQKVTTIREAEQHFNLVQTVDPDFFTENLGLKPRPFRTAFEISRLSSQLLVRYTYFIQASFA